MKGFEYKKFTILLQKIMNYMFQMTEVGRTCNAQMIDEGINYILDISSDTYKGFSYQMPEKQRNVFLAIATA